MASMQMVVLVFLKFLKEYIINKKSCGLHNREFLEFTGSCRKTFFMLDCNRNMFEIKMFASVQIVQNKFWPMFSKPQKKFSLICF